MKIFLNPLGLLSLAFAATTAFMNRPELFLLGLLGYGASLAWIGLGNAKKIRHLSVLDQVSNLNRSRLKPVSDLANQIRALVSENHKVAAIRALGSEAVNDAEGAVGNCIRLLDRRERLEKVLASIPSQSVSESVEQAEQEISRIDSLITQTETVLSDLRAKLAYLAAGDVSVDAENLRESMIRLESLSSSAEEVEAIMKGTE